MAKRHPFKKTKPGEPILVTARQLEASCSNIMGNLIHAIATSSSALS